MHRRDLPQMPDSERLAAQGRDKHALTRYTVGTRSLPADVLRGRSAGFLSFWGEKGTALEGLLFGLITLLIVAIVVMIICYVVARLLGQVMPGAAPYVWLIYAIGGLIVLIYALRLFSPLLHL
jgi:hypothetical protein